MQLQMHQEPAAMGLEPVFCRPVAAVILAAGRSTRMKSRLPKPLHPICGIPMTAHVVRACRAAGIERIVVVIGHEADVVRAELGNDVEYAVQETQRGTGDAVRAALPLFENWQGTLVVLAGDVPLLSSLELHHLIELQLTTGAAAVMLTAVLDNPAGYGRIVRDAEGQVARIVEQRDADAAVAAIREVNPSIYAFDSALLWPALTELRPDNVQGEYYLTDVISRFRGQGAQVRATAVTDSRDILGVNTRIELAAVGAILKSRLLESLMLSGVTITDPVSTYVDVDVEVGADTVIEASTLLLRGTKIGSDCVIGPFSRIENSRVGDGSRVIASHLEESVLEAGVRVGPFAHLRPGTHLGPKVKVGNFVEVKNASLGAGSQASHLSYLGDAEIGAATNIGAGTITCNYDGYRKHRTTIGSGAFIGSNSTLVAPVTVGDGAFIAAASAITQDVPADALGIARERVTIKEGWAKEYRVRNRSVPAVPGKTAQRSGAAQSSAVREHGRSTEENADAELRPEDLHGQCKS